MDIVVAAAVPEADADDHLVCTTGYCRPAGARTTGKWLDLVYGDGEEFGATFASALKRAGASRLL